MTETKLEQDLGRFDFSNCHSIKERLYQQLLNMHRRENAASDDLWGGRKMECDELDLAAAAGNPALENHTFDSRGKK